MSWPCRLARFRIRPIRPCFRAKWTDTLPSDTLWDQPPCALLDGVFEIGNIGPEENIERFLPMHSVSVGDIIEAPNGAYWIVDGCGFAKVEIV